MWPAEISCRNLDKRWQSGFACPTCITAHEANPLTASKQCSPRHTCLHCYGPFVCQQVTTHKRCRHTGQSSAQLSFVFCALCMATLQILTALAPRPVSELQISKCLSKPWPLCCISDWTSRSTAAQRLRVVRYTQRHAVFLLCVTFSGNNGQG